MKIDPHFSTAGESSYEQVEWQKRDAKLVGKDGEIIFNQKDVEVPSNWSDNAFTIAVQKYFRGNLGSEERENSVRNMIERVVSTIADWGVKDNYFNEEEREIFAEELRWLIVKQYGAFNSPVWFNVGVEDNPQCSACFILEVKDNLESILELARTEAMIFKGGSGSGINFSTLRSSDEKLAGGGKASGPVSFMKGFDAFAGVIKSGGKTRRAAKMVILNDDHPDLEEFISSKMKEEDKARALVREGYDGSFDGEAYSSVYFQNANHSIRVSDEFMEAVVNDDHWELKGVVDSSVNRKVRAKDIWKQIAQAAHACGDPGLQFDTTINSWHTCIDSGRINASNPCSEFMFLDNSACNLASLNLKKFLKEDLSFDLEGFVKAVRIFILAMDIIVDNASYPTRAIGENSRKFRPLGIGYTNLGGLLMSLGLAYDSDKGRELAALITSLMTGSAFLQSAVIAGEKGVFSEFELNNNSFHKVISKHISAHEQIKSKCWKAIDNYTRKIWQQAESRGLNNGYRNSQVSLLAPTGTIGFLMDSDSTGIEPLVALVIYKQLVGGGTFKLVSSSVKPALENLEYQEDEIREILEYLKENSTLEGCELIRDEHLDVFDTALRPVGGTRTISYLSHLKMMASVQPFLSGAISKTVNLPHDITPEEIEDIYIRGWKMGLKSVAIYREGSKGTEPLSTSSDVDETEFSSVKGEDSGQLRRRHLPEERLSITHKFEVAGHEGYLTVGYFQDGKPGEVFIAMAKEGSTISGLMDAFAIAISLSLQHGVPLDLLCDKYMHSRFEPSGITANAEIPVASSLVDYIFRWLYLHHIDGVNKTIASMNGNSISAEKSEEYDHLREEKITQNQQIGDLVSSPDAPICPDCGFVMVRNGSCYKCMNCGSSSGCS
ncbi:MAG: vitamin B12-dependent ribonucleotide reductase [Myxococcota bacterium]